MNTHLIGTREAWLDRAPKRRNETGYAGTINIEAPYSTYHRGDGLRQSRIADGDKTKDGRERLHPQTARPGKSVKSCLVAGEDDEKALATNF